MNNEEVLDDILSLARFFRKYVNDPNNSNRIYKISSLIKRLNLVLDRIK